MNTATYTTEEKTAAHEAFTRGFLAAIAGESPTFHSVEVTDAAGHRTWWRTWEMVGHDAHAEMLRKGIRSNAATEFKVWWAAHAGIGLHAPCCVSDEFAFLSVPESVKTVERFGYDIAEVVFG